MDPVQALEEEYQVLEEEYVRDEIHLHVIVGIYDVGIAASWDIPRLNAARQRKHSISESVSTAISQGTSPRIAQRHRSRKWPEAT